MGKPGPKPLVNQMIQANAFRSRPANVEEEENFQEEEYAGEEQYCECDEQGQEEYGEQQLRARPMVVPVRTGAPIVNPRIPSLIPHHYHTKTTCSCICSSWTKKRAISSCRI